MLVWLYAAIIMLVCAGIPIYIAWRCTRPTKVQCGCGRWNAVQNNGWNSWECECGNRGKLRMW